MKMSDRVATERQSILENLSENWAPKEMRDLAATLLRFADAIEQQWDGSNSASIFKWPNALRRIERNSFNLALKAKRIYENRQGRNKFLPEELLAEPAWDMLLELFMQFSGGAKVSTSSLCIASNSPQSTALRYLAQLEELGLVERFPAKNDRRVQLVTLTDRGVVGVGSILERL